MPAVATLDAFERAAADAAGDAVDLRLDADAGAAAQHALAASGLLLLGETHGVRENPLLARALMAALGVPALALEWHEEMAPTVRSVATGGPVLDHPFLWFGDGRVTAHHVAVLRELGPGTDVVLFDGTHDSRPDWSRHDLAMAERLLAAAPGPCLVVAGSLHTRTRRIRQGVPMGAHLARRRPGVLEIRIAYGGGSFYNVRPRRFLSPRRRPAVSSAPARLRAARGHLVLDLPWATEATVPQRADPFAPA